MMVYFVTQKPMGSCITLHPQLPKSSWNEGSELRICVSSSILGALSSIGPNLRLDCNTFIYKTSIINPLELIQPNGIVSDVDMTGELWITKSTPFLLHKIIRLSSVDSFRVFSNLETDNDNIVDIYNFQFYDTKSGEY